MADVMDRDTAVLHIPKMIRQDEYGYRTSVDGKEVSPLTVVPLDKAFPISKMNGPATSSVVLRRFADGYYVCSCPAWKFSSERDKMRKTCQHLKDVLGEDYEAERISLAKEAKSAVWEQTRFRRTTSDGHQARHNHAKSVLDSHYQQRSQSQSEASSSNLGIVPSTSAAPSFSRKDIISEATRNNSSVSKPLSTHANATQGDSDTETEEEDMSPSQPPRRSRPAPPQTSTLAHPVSTASSTRARSVYEDNDDDHYGLDPDDVQISPSKRARRGGKYTRDDDDKVSAFCRDLSHSNGGTLTCLVSLSPLSLTHPTGLVAASQALVARCRPLQAQVESHGPHRMVDQREARRSASLLGWSETVLSSKDRMECASMVEGT